MAPAPTKIDRLKDLFTVVDRDFLTHEEAKQVVKSLGGALKKARDGLGGRIDRVGDDCRRRFSAASNELDQAIRRLRTELGRKADARQTQQQLERVRADLRAIDRNLRIDMPVMPDLAPLELEVARLRNSMPPRVDGTGLWKSMGDLYDELRAAKEEMVKLRDARAPGIRVFGGARGFQLLVDGEKKGQVNYLNLVAGAGIDVSYNQANGRNDVTFSVSPTGALTVLAATGTIDDSNTDFSFESTPSLVVINGASYRDGKGITITGTSVTLDNPVGSGGDIYGLG